jgi:putative transposase
MARKRRIHIPGFFYHVMLRGNGGQNIFFSNEDRYRFYLLLQEGVERFGHRIHAFCLMTNHIHLLIQVGEIPLSKILQNLSFRYTRYQNKKHGRVGHLFQGRFRSLVVDERGYLLMLVRYIHCNPIRAALVDDAIVYPWSSHQCYMGVNNISWLTTSVVLARFHHDDALAQGSYDAFMKNEDTNTTLKVFDTGTHQGVILGEDDFAERIFKKNKMYLPYKIDVECLIEHMIYETCKSLDVKKESLYFTVRNNAAAQTRGMIALLARRLPYVSLEQLADRFGRNSTTLSRAATDIEKKCNNEATVRFLVQKLEKSVRDFLLGDWKSIV